MRLKLIIFMILLFATPAFGLVTYYVDPTYTDTGSNADGSASDPWTDISSNWSSINTSLAGDDVTVYVSARIVASDTQEDLGESITVSSKTADPGNTLTIDGNSFYNTSDSHESGSWSAYTGSVRAKCAGVISQNAGHTKYNDFTVTGFEIANCSGKCVSVCGDNWTVDDNLIHDNGDSPLFLIVPTSDAAHEGSSAYCPASDNITVSNNTLYDSDGEVIYVGGGGCSSNDANFGGNCQASATGGDSGSHTNITISGNTIYNGGSLGSQGDAIDIKAAFVNLTVTGNEIYNLTSGSIRAIVMQGWDGTDQNIVIEKNYIHDNTAIEDAVIAVVNSWGTPNGVHIRNNIIDSNSTGEGIKSYDCGGGYIYNNTIYNNSSFGMLLTGTWTVKNKDRKSVV